MDAFQRAVVKAEKSSFSLWLLNTALQNRIPFNKPHGVAISKINPNGFEVKVPYKRKNLNHIKGIHACALATASEYVAGLSLMRRLGTEKYRLIMETMHIEYRYQAKTDVIASFELSETFLQENVLQPLESNDKVVVEFTSLVHDTAGNLVSEALTRWQIKAWDKVKTKL